MSVWYLDTEDEITDAVARLRGSDEDAIVLVVPAGARIATGRINFRLLAREADSRDKRIAIVSDDEQVRALVAAAGVLVYARVADAEAALERGDVPPDPAPPGGDGARVEDDVTTPLESETSTSGWLTRRRLLAATTGLVLSFVVIGGVTSLRILPTAQITLVPRTEHLGPIAVAVTASTDVEAVDVPGGEIPAVSLSIPLEAMAAFPASGTQAIESNATGEVLFSSADQSFDQSIATGTRIETAGGVTFVTTAPAVLRRPSDGPGPAEVRAPVQATRPGPGGNVEAGAITVVPSLESQGISVRNEAPSTGGRRDEIAIVTVEDYDGAAIDLQNRLAGEMNRWLRDPERVPEELTLFAETARLGPVSYSPAAEDVVGSRVDSFQLTAASTAQAVAVDEALVEAVAIERLAAEAPVGSALVEGSVSAAPGTGTARGDIIRYAAIAEGDASVVVDPALVLEEVRGLPVFEAQAILEAFGEVDVTIWPDFLGDLPADSERITLEIEVTGHTE